MRRRCYRGIDGGQSARSVMVVVVLVVGDSPLVQGPNRVESLVLLCREDRPSPALLAIVTFGRQSQLGALVVAIALCLLLASRTVRSGCDTHAA